MYLCETKKVPIAAILIRNHSQYCGIVQVCTFSLATVGVETEAAENLFVEIDVVRVHGSVEGERDHLGNVVGLQFARNASTVGRAVAIGKAALSGVALGGAVGVGVDGCNFANMNF